MSDYRVTWEIDVEADNPREAAFQAMLSQGEHSTANVFMVRQWRTDHRTGHPSGDPVEIDLGDEPRHLILAEKEC